MEPPATQNPKKLENKKLETPKIQHSQKWVSGWVFVSKWGDFFVADRPKITTNPKIFEMGPRASKRCPLAPKITKNVDYRLPKSRKSHCTNDPLMQKLSKNEANEKARWRDCAQRTGVKKVQFGKC